MELTQIRYFLEVARSQHITRSAERLHVAQPALTKAIHHLEAELGVPLFLPKGRNIVLSEYGRFLEKQLRPLLAELDAIPAQLRAMAHTENRTVRLNVLAASQLVTDAVIAYNRAHTGEPLSFRLTQNAGSRLYDICVTTSLFHPAPPDRQGQEFAVTERIFLAVPATHMLTTHDIVYRNNIFIDMPMAIHIDNRMEGWGRSMLDAGGIAEQRLNAVRYNEPEAGRIAALLQAMRTQDAVERVSSLLRMLPLLALTLGFELYNTVYVLRYTDFQLDSRASRIYFFMYLALILVAGLCLALFWRWASAKAVLGTQYVYAAFLLLWGLGITLYDQRVSTNTMVYVMMLVCVAVLFYLPPWLSAPLFAAAQITFLVCLPLFQPTARDNYGSSINSSFLALSCFFISYSQYRACRLNFINNWVIMAQNREILEKSAELDFIANHDALTGLLNQRFLSTWLQGRFAGGQPAVRPTGRAAR